jgi:hypothetical protein
MFVVELFLGRWGAGSNLNSRHVVQCIPANFVEMVRCNVLNSVH